MANEASEASETTAGALTRIEDILEEADDVGEVIDSIVEREEDIEEALINMPIEPDWKLISNLLLDALGDSLTEILNDRVIRTVKAKPFVSNALNQLEQDTRILTSLANFLGVELGGKPVLPSGSWAYWNARRMENIAASMLSMISQLKRENGVLAETANGADAKYNRLDEQHKHLTEKYTQLDSSVDARVNDKADQIESLKKILSSYSDVERYYVARIDLLTKQPVAYYQGDKSSVKSVMSLENATIFTNLREAKDVRSGIVRGIRKKIGMKGYNASNQIAIFQVALNKIDVKAGFEDGE